ncbi:MAG: UDP-N-acetylglucosamine--LPS N-acetylglucosamine transferase [Clostridiaceae bacterium]|nr:UDP-N-acetylglucosamine--LPS N-acetylglucosamine transferase [Clostridiaceae bacterium]
MDVLYLSISMGAGHLRAAEALKEYVEQRYPDSRSLVIDTFKYINPIVHKIFVDGYLNIIKSIPFAYGTLYRMSEQMDNINKLSNTLSKFFSYKLIKVIEDFNPSIIVCTHPFPLQIVSCLKRDEKIDIPSVGILTDYVNHPFWFHDNIEAYVVAHNSIKRDMVKCGIPENRVYSYGIPVSKVFLRKTSRDKLLEKFGLEDKVTVLIMGGSLGFGDIKGVFFSLLRSRRDIQIIVVTGKNKRLRQQLQRYVVQYDKKVLLIGYTDEICDLMDISDLILTKPGGMTISEALIKGLPIFLMTPIPGQEERNSSFLTSNGVAEKIDNEMDVQRVINEVLDNRNKLLYMKDKSKELSLPNSGYKILQLMEELVI